MSPIHPRFAEAVRHLYPDANFIRDLRLEDHGDGPVLTMWNLPGAPPGQSEIESLLPVLDLPPRRLVSKALIVDRLIEAGKLSAARAALDSQPLDVQERWNARTAIYADDPTSLALLQGIGADPAAILAP